MQTDHFLYTSSLTAEYNIKYTISLNISLQVLKPITQNLTLYTNSTTCPERSRRAQHYFIRGINSNFLPSNKPLSLSLISGITRRAMKESVI